MFGLYGMLVIAAVWWFWIWGTQLLDLMERRDAEFPGRMDKVLWVVILLVVPVIGVIVYCVWKNRRAESKDFHVPEGTKEVSGT